MNFSNRLFWDIDLNSLNTNELVRFIVERVITRGTLNDWITLKEFYGLQKIKEEILHIRSLDPKTLTFFSTYFNLEKKDFKCFSTKPFAPKHFNY